MNVSHMSMKPVSSAITDTPSSYTLSPPLSCHGLGYVQARFRTIKADAHLHDTSVAVCYLSNAFNLCTPFHVYVMLIPRIRVSK